MCKSEVETSFILNYNEITIEEGERKMENIKVLLCCGAGLSSGFLAQRARKSAKKRNLDINIQKEKY